MVAVACVSAPWSDAAQPTRDINAAPPDLTDEVLVRGTRLRELRAAIVEAEERFYSRYNDVNKVDDFDIECAEDAHTGTKIPHRRCFTRLQLEAMAQQGMETLQMFQQQAAHMASGNAEQAPSAGMSAVGRPPNTDPQAVWLAHYDEYRDNFLYLLKTHPDLRRMARAAERAQQRYDREYKRRLKGRLFVID
jgi:hypothetical protein